jgi:membrane protein YdbS with pleckstrin-like domain
MVQQRLGQPAGPQQPAQQRRPTFKGQQPDEIVQFVLRPHPLWYLTSSWRLVLLVIVLLGVYFVIDLLAFYGVPGWLLWIVVIVLLVLHGIRWISEDLNSWLLRYYILTDWRLIDQTGLFYETRNQAHLDRIQQLRVDRPNALASWLDIGDVVITTASEGSDFKFEGVHHPRQVALAIQMAMINRPDRLLAQPVPINNPAMRAIMEHLEEHDHPAPPPPTPTRSARHPIPIAMLPNEFVLENIRRHWFNYLLRSWGAFAVAIGSIVVGSVLGSASTTDIGFTPVALAILGVVIGGAWALGVWLNFADDFLVLTTHRVIDLDRYFYVIAESAAEARYARIQDVQINIPLLGQLLGYGTITISTAGRAADITMDYMPKPKEIQDRIFSRIFKAEERTERTLRRIRRTEFRRWMGTMLNEMVVDVPNVVGLPLLEAAGRARAAGMRLIVTDERTLPNEPPGRVLEQSPRTATTALIDSELSVVLSGR